MTNDRLDSLTSVAPKPEDYGLTPEQAMEEERKVQMHETVRNNSTLENYYAVPLLVGFIGGIIGHQAAPGMGTLIGFLVGGVVATVPILAMTERQLKPYRPSSRYLAYANACKTYVNRQTSSPG